MPSSGILGLRSTGPGSWPGTEDQGRAGTAPCPGSGPARTRRAPVNAPLRIPASDLRQPIVQPETNADRAKFLKTIRAVTSTSDAGGRGTVTMRFECECCGRTYSTEGNLQAHRRKSKHSPGDRKCKECGKFFRTYQGLAVHTSRVHGISGGLHEVRCAECGAVKTVPEHELAEAARFFCNRNCRGRWTSKNLVGPAASRNAPKTTTPCETCGTPVRVLDCIRKRGGGRFCSPSCSSRFNWSKGSCKGYRGAGHPNWKGGTARGYDGWSDYDRRRWAAKVKARDSLKCQLCGRQWRSTWGGHAHHKASRSRYPALRDRIENGITLCYRCPDGRGHLWIHSKAGEQLRERWEREGLSCL